MCYIVAIMGRIKLIHNHVHVRNFVQFRCGPDEWGAVIADDVVTLILKLLAWLAGLCRGNAHLQSCARLQKILRFIPDMVY